MTFSTATPDYFSAEYAEAAASAISQELREYDECCYASYSLSPRQIAEERRDWARSRQDHADRAHGATTAAPAWQERYIRQPDGSFRLKPEFWS